MPSSLFKPEPVDKRPIGRWLLLRWFGSSATLAVPQAAGPVAFSLLALSATGQTKGGAAIILAMTLAQALGAVPVTQFFNRLPPATALRLLVASRTLALVCVALGAQHQISFDWLIVLAALAGSVNGAADGYLRSLLNHLVPASGLRRTLGIAATLNEATFVLAPIAASGLGLISPVLAVLVLAALGAVPAVLVPSVERVGAQGSSRAGTSAISAPILLWLSCAAAEGATVAVYEIGAVALALSYGYQPALAILFTVPLCLASVTGGLWISVRNRASSRRTVVVQLSVLTLGSALAAFGPSIATTILGLVLIGLVLAPLGTFFSLALDTLAPLHRRPEVFALLRSANAVGVIFASALLTMASLSATLAIVTGVMLVVTIVAALAPVAGDGDVAKRPLDVA